MAWRRLSLGGLQFTLFGDRRRAGAELSIPSSWLGRGGPAQPAFMLEADSLPEPPPADASLAERVAKTYWYHSIDLGNGIVTPGFMDHREIVPLYRLPDSLAGKRVLDVAKFDGFWSFQFERRGASEVVALDIREARELDLPFRTRAQASDVDLSRPFGAGFEIARQALQSKVSHLHCNVYDLDPARHGRFDLVHCGDLLLHLRDPALALARMRGVTSGAAIFSDTFYPDCDRADGVPLMEYQGGRGDNIWWRFGALSLRRMIEDAGFDHVEELARFQIGPRGSAERIWHIVYRAR